MSYNNNRKYPADRRALNIEIGSLGCSEDTRNQRNLTLATELSVQVLTAYVGNVVESRNIYFTFTCVCTVS